MLALALTGGVSLAALNSGSGSDPDLATSDAPQAEAAAPAAADRIVSEVVELPEVRVLPSQSDTEPGEPGFGRGRHSPSWPPHDGDPCKGPPRFAGQPPAGDTEEAREANRAAQAEAHSKIRRDCPHGDDRPGNGPADHAGPPDHAGRPEAPGGG